MTDTIHGNSEPAPPLGLGCNDGLGQAPERAGFDEYAFLADFDITRSTGRAGMYASEVTQRAYLVWADRQREIERLRAALRQVAQAHAWLAFGECRSFGSDLPILTPSDADAVARVALGEYREGPNVEVTGTTRRGGQGRVATMLLLAPAGPGWPAVACPVHR